MPQWKGTVDIIPFFKAGDPAPEGYTEWHDWAAVQHGAGRRQSLCEHQKWVFPGEGCERHLALEVRRQQGRLI